MLFFGAVYRQNIDTGTYAEQCFRPVLVQKIVISLSASQDLKFSIVKCGFSLKITLFCSHSSTKVVHWIGNIGSANPNVKSVIRKPNLLTKFELGVAKNGLDCSRWCSVAMNLQQNKRLQSFLVHPWPKRAERLLYLRENWFWFRCSDWKDCHNTQEGDDVWKYFPRAVLQGGSCCGHIVSFIRYISELILNWPIDKCRINWWVWSFHCLNQYSNLKISENSLKSVF